jgi:hypothetical protein
MCWLLLFCYLRLLLAVLNSPIVIAILSLSLGGVVAACLSSGYQRKQQVFNLRVEGIKTLLDVHAKLLHTHLTVQAKEDHANWMQLIAAERYLRVLFPDSEAQGAFKTYFDEAGRFYKTPIGTGAQQAEEKAIEQLQRALNGLMRVLVARVGISEKG